MNVWNGQIDGAYQAVKIFVIALTRFLWVFLKEIRIEIDQNKFKSLKKWNFESCLRSFGV